MLPCETLIEVANLIIEFIGNNEYSIEENDTGLVLIIDFKVFKKKLKFNLILNEIKDPKAMLVELSQIILKMSVNSPKPLYQDSEVLQENELPSAIGLILERKSN